MKNQPGPIKNHENQPVTMKNPSGRNKQKRHRQTDRNLLLYIDSLFKHVIIALTLLSSSFHTLIYVFLSYLSLLLWPSFHTRHCWTRNFGLTYKVFFLRDTDTILGDPERLSAPELHFIYHVTFLFWVPFYISCLVQCTCRPISVSFLIRTSQSSWPDLSNVHHVWVPNLPQGWCCILSNILCPFFTQLCPFSLPRVSLASRCGGSETHGFPSASSDTSRHIVHVWEDFQTQTNVLSYITWRTESRFHHRCKASLLAIWWWWWGCLEGYSTLLGFSCGFPIVATDCQGLGSQLWSPP